MKESDDSTIELLKSVIRKKDDELYEKNCFIFEKGKLSGAMQLEIEARDQRIIEIEKEKARAIEGLERLIEKASGLDTDFALIKRKLGYQEEFLTIAISSDSTPDRIGRVSKILKRINDEK